MLIVLEGCDGTGKTTLARRLMRGEDAYYIHATYRWKTRMSLYHMAVIKRAIKMLERGKFVVVDRWWPSEMIYGDVYRGSHEPLENLRMLHRLALRYGAVYVLCHRKTRQRQLDVFKALKAQRAEMYEYDDRIGQLHDEYQEFWAAQKHGQDHRWVLYDCDDAIDRESYIDYKIYMIKMFAKTFSMLRQSQDLRLEHSSGCISGKNVMVGEVINPNYRSMKWPWVAFKGCSRDVMRALIELGKAEQHFVWTNALGPHEHRKQLVAYLETLPHHRNIVAMGQVSSAFLTSNKIKHQVMQHPAYITRFQGYEALVNSLRGIIK